MPERFQPLFQVRLELIVRDLHQISLKHADDARRDLAVEGVANGAENVGWRDEHQFPKLVPGRSTVELGREHLSKLAFLQSLWIVARRQRVMGGGMAMERRTWTVRCQVGGSLVGCPRVEEPFGTEAAARRGADKARVLAVSDDEQQTPPVGKLCGVGRG